MATQSYSDSESKNIDAGQGIPAEAPVETMRADAPAGEEPAAELVSVSAASAPAPAAEIVDIVSAPLAVVEEAVESVTEGFAASFVFDASAWSKKSLELWAENAAAFFSLAEQVAKAQTLEEIVDLQSRFAKDRVDAFLRQSKDLMDFAKSASTLSTAPLCKPV